ncbi:MAG: hypothetical protein H5T62_07365 [Anaerolineae bacterium]|nr:hypothetical protein [Anaerolineae bacterium]
MYEHLNLRAWPFQVVPDPEFATFWAGRRQTKKQLERLLWKMQFAPKSGLHLLWANFGMGKTHTLLHLQHLCQQTQGRLIPVYAVMPKRAGGFLEVYRMIVSGLPYDFLRDQLVKVGNSWSGSLALHPMFSKSPGVVNAILAIRSGDAEKATFARQWLIAQPGLTARHRRTIGVTYRIKTPEDAINALTTLTRLATFNLNPPTKLVIMLDEYQRIGELKQRVRSEINAGLHSYYNEHPNGLEVILSFSFGREDNVAYLLSDELKSRAEPQSISLDVLSPGEAIEFIRDLLAQFRLREDERWAYPFSPEAVETLVGHIAQAKALTPRRLMLYANHVLLESQFARGPDDTSEIMSQEVKELLTDPRLGEMDVDSDL